MNLMVKRREEKNLETKGAAAEKVEMTKESEAGIEVKKEEGSKRKGEENLERHEAQKDGVEEKTSAEEAETLTGPPRKKKKESSPQKDDCDDASKPGLEAIGDEYVEAAGGTVKTAVQKKDKKESKQLQKLKEEKEKESKGGKPQAQEEKKPEAVKEARPENEDEVEGEEEKNMKKSKQENDNKVGLRLFNVKVEVMQRGDVITKVLLSAMMLCNFVRLYISEALVALNVARFVIVSPMSSRTFAERFLPHLSDYG